MRVVLDSNILIAAFATQGLCHALFEACLINQEIILSEEIIREVDRGLRHRIKVQPSVASDIIAFLKEHAQIKTPAFLPKNTCRDPDDIHVLGLAVASKSERIVTGDNDLLVMKSFRGTPILSPREFWNDLQKKARRT